MMQCSNSPLILMTGSLSDTRNEYVCTSEVCCMPKLLSSLYKDEAAEDMGRCSEQMQAASGGLSL